MELNGPWLGEEGLTWSINIPSYSLHLMYIWVIGTRTGKKVDEMSLIFFKVRSLYGQIKAKIDIILSPSILS